jgi:hypothetical protein
MSGPILQAIAQGFTAKNILKVLAKKSPKVGKYVALATAAGFSPHVTLKKLVQPGESAANTDDYLTLNEKTRKTQKDNRRKELTEAIGVLGTAGAAAAGLYSALGKDSPIEAWKKGVLNSDPGSNLNSFNQPTTSTLAPQANASLTQSIQKEAPELIKEGMGSPAPEQHTPERERLLKIAENLPEEKPKAIVGEGIKPLQIDTPIVRIPRVETQFPHIRKFVDKHLEAGKSPEEIYENIQKSGLKGIADRHTQQTGQSYLDRIKELAGDQGQSLKADHEMSNFKNMGSGMVASLYEGLFTSLKNGKDTFAGIKDPVLQRAKPYFDRGLIKSPEDLQKFVNQGPDSLSQEVITPLGAGTIHNEKGDNAFVKIDNKLHKISKDELEEPPKSAVEAVTNYLNIPEKDRSSNVALFAWNPDEKRAYFQFHNEDSFYEYTDVDPAVVDAIAEKRAIPKTQGGNEYGVWSPEDAESIGAALWKYIISTPKYAKNKKGEPVNPYYKKLPIKYDYWQKLRKPVRRKKSGG